VVELAPGDLPAFEQLVPGPRAVLGEVADDERLTITDVIDLPVAELAAAWGAAS
jgi:hypothetical protein